MPVLLTVGPMPVAVLEIDAEVLHRLPTQLLRHEPMNRPGQRGGEVEDRSQLIGGVSPPVESGRGELAQPFRCVGREEMGAAVDGVHRLAFWALAGEVGAEPGGHVPKTIAPTAQRVFTQSHGGRL